MCLLVWLLASRCWYVSAVQKIVCECVRRMSCVTLSPHRRLYLISSDFPTKILYMSLFPTYVPHAPIIRSSLILPPDDWWWGVLIAKLLNCSFHHSPVTSYFLGPSNFHTTLFSFHNERDQVSHPYNATGGVLGACMSRVFMLLARKLVDKNFGRKIADIPWVASDLNCFEHVVFIYIVHSPINALFIKLVKV